MNQKNIFTGISIMMILQGIGIFALSGKIALDSFPTLGSEGLSAVSEMATVVAVLYIGIGTILHFTKSSPQVVPGMAVLFGLLALNTMKHIFISGVVVPIPLFVLQILFFGSMVFLLTTAKKVQTA